MTASEHPARRAAPSSPARPASSSASISRRSAGARRARAHGGRAGRRAGHAVRAERLRPHRARRHGDRPLQAHRDGPGALHRVSPTIVAEELDADWSQMRAVALARRRRALQEPRLRRAGHRRLDRHRQSATSRCGRPAPRRAPCWSPPPPRNGACRQARSPCRERPHPPRRIGPRKRLRRARRARRPRSSCRPSRKLKDPKDFELIGTDVPSPRHGREVDRHRRSSRIDISLPDMLTALVVAPGRMFGANGEALRRQRSAQGAGRGRREGRCRRASPSTPRTTWAALQGPRRAEGRVGHSPTAETRSSDAIVAEYREKARARGVDVTNDGDVDAGARRGGDRRSRRRYVFPYLAHAPMEPLDAVLVKADDGAIDVYSGAQFQTMDQQVDRRRCSGSIRRRCACTRSLPAAASAAAAQPARPILQRGGGGLQGDRRHASGQAHVDCARTTFAAATIGRSTCTG